MSRIDRIPEYIDPANLADLRRLPMRPAATADTFEGIRTLARSLDISRAEATRYALEVGIAALRDADVLDPQRSHERCPHCGGTEHIETNGEGMGAPGLTLLCVRPCDPEESSIDEHAASDPDERRICGMQWEPNE